MEWFRTHWNLVYNPLISAAHLYNCAATYWLTTVFYILVLIPVLWIFVPYFWLCYTIFIFIFNPRSSPMAQFETPGHPCGIWVDMRNLLWWFNLSPATNSYTHVPTINIVCPPSSFTRGGIQTRPHHTRHPENVLFTCFRYYRY